MFYDKEPEALPWDYFFANYERDLLTLKVDRDEIKLRYPLISASQIEKDIEEISALNITKNAIGIYVPTEVLD